MIEYKLLVGYKIADGDKNNLLKLCENKINAGTKFFIVTLNSIILLNSILNKKFGYIVKNSDLIIPDGSGIIWASKVLGNEIKHKIPGIDFMQSLLGMAYEKRMSVFLLGSKPKVINKLYSNLKKWYDRINFVGKYHGYFNKNNTDYIIEGINKVEPDILFIALGSPKQEEFISKNYNRIKAKVMIGVGGSFDVISGYTKRAPVWFIKNNLEWLYRSFTSPIRIVNIFKIIIFVIIISFFKVKKIIMKHV